MLDTAAQPATHLDAWRERHDALHQTIEATLLDQMSDEQLRACPYPDLASVAWHLWHIARCEDVTVNLLIAGRDQVLDEDDWLARVNAGRTDIGITMTPQEVAAFNDRVDLAALRGYLRAVKSRTDEVMPAVSPDAWADKPPLDLVDRALESAVAAGFRDTAAPFWRSVNRAWFLWWLVGEHHWMHFGQALVTRDVIARQTARS